MGTGGVLHESDAFVPGSPSHVPSQASTPRDAPPASAVPRAGTFWAAPRRPVPRPPGAADEGAPAGASSELSQRAQRAFQSSAAWFARASRKIQDSVRDLQERHGGARRAGSPGGDCEAVYRDWAAQIERQSPRTRAAMLGALSPDDRAAVERIVRARGGGAAGSPRPGSRAERSHSNRPAEAVSPRAWTPVDGAWSDGEASPLSVQETSQHLAQALREAHLGGAPEAGEALGSPVRAARPRPASPLAPRRASAEPAPEFDLMGLTDDAPRAAPAQAARKSSSADHIEALFSVAPPRPAPRAERPPRSAPLSAEEGPEPEERRRLREARLAAQRAKMAASLAEARERESAEASDKAARVAIREALAPQMDAWVSGRRDNIRALLSTLHTVLWEGSGWKAPSIADIVEDAQVKRWYMKANLVVHPDKVRQKGGSPEAVARADMIFDVLKSAWGKFETQR
ncbi:hypothetical protein QBZ16_001385 [Prototheca wickerhamii]|uniref:J domain-containing protein n=1 Tax=Prototheca wickerhamii TaxID=3111 RepID=A0AAD9MG46_PROWI|nr:hypothetical protein QBZ16_001385 [Prototheca wickerhamii]